MSGSRIFTASDWKTAGISFFAVLTLYVYTLAPTVTLEYSGALVVAANHLGVAKPPGYPIWTLLAKGFICLFPFAKYQGHPNPAWAVNLMSAFFGALACGVLALLVSHESKHLFPGNWNAQQNSGRIGAVTGVVAALLFALSPAMWSQAVIAETHTLTNFYMLALLALSLRWSVNGGMGMACILAFGFGLGLTVSPLLILFAPVLLLAAAFVSIRMLARMAVAVTLFLGFILAEYVWGRAQPSMGAFILYAILETTILLAHCLPCSVAHGQQPSSAFLCLRDCFPFSISLSPPPTTHQSTWDQPTHGADSGMCSVVDNMKP